jgi:hypothetical protein
MSTHRVNGNEPTSEGAENRNVQGASKSHTVNRRTIVQGAAWSIPVVAVAVGAPLAAASPAPTLTFTNGPYTVDACGTLNNVTLRATTDGTTPKAGDLVTVTLPAGLTFSDGSTTKLFTTDASGNITITGIKASGSSQGGAVTATDATSTAAVTVTVTPNGSAFSATGSGAVTPLSSSIPADSTAVGFRYFLAPNGDLYYGDGNRVATGVTSIGSQYVDGLGDLVTYVTPSGAFSATGSGAVAPLSSSIPADSTAVGFRYFLAPNGDLYYGDGNRVATGVTSIGSQYIEGLGDLVTYVKSSCS